MKAPLDANNKVGLEVSTEKTKFIFMYYNHTVGQIHNIKKANIL
jgi:hypothetical protein